MTKKICIEQYNGINAYQFHWSVWIKKESIICDDIHSFQFIYFF